MENGFHMLLYRAFHAQRACLRPWRAALGLGPGQPKLIAYLSQNGPCCQRQLAAYCEIDPAAVSRMLDNMRKAGFVTCRADERNRRSDVVELTEKGRTAYGNWRAHCREMEGIMLQGFSEEERAAFAQYLSRAYNNFKVRQGERGGSRT